MYHEKTFIVIYWKIYKDIKNLWNNLEKREK